MGEAVTAPAAATGRHQRSWKNLLLDKHFQLKYTSYLVGIALVLSVSLGAILWRTSEAVIRQSEETVTQGEQVVERGREVVTESKKVSAVVQMNIVKDPVYSDNPALLEAFQADARKQDEVLQKQQDDLEAQAAALKRRSSEIAERQRTAALALVGVLALLVVFIGLAGIFVTHKVAGPIHKMKRQIREVGEGSLKIPGKLRKGDELVDFFDTFSDMVKSLRERQKAEVDLLETALTRIESKVDKADLEPIYEVKRKMEAALDA